MFRRDFAAKMGLAHCAGLLGVVIVGAVMRADPRPDQIIGLFFIGLFMSAFLFVPVLVLMLTNLRAVLLHRLALVVLGPALMTGLTIATFGLDAGKVIAIETALSSVVLYLLIRNDEVPPDSWPVRE
ncbi:hypothetical protein [Porphyrobacter sp. YT40]|uniref:hypothetical protein n=1 Tax=Porphyrobacter sp. YT40 TaxID=2547601 RepID=UPI001144E947|nr:hypothetical protein [Porphyrobacter sp. YT40]QDH35308.1 hypothetical protein E2E27_13865 [Porphyrobacter sp. YT40]